MFEQSQFISTHLREHILHFYPLKGFLDSHNLVLHDHNQGFIKTFDIYSS